MENHDDNINDHEFISHPYYHTFLYNNNSSLVDQDNYNLHQPSFDDQYDLNLSLSLSHSHPLNPSTPTPQPNPNPTRPPNPSPNPTEPSHQIEPRKGEQRARKAPRLTPKKVKTDPIPPPYPWATDRRAMIHSLKYLLENGITTISEEMICKKCDQTFTEKFDLEEKYQKVHMTFVKEIEGMHNRAPEKWIKPKYVQCKSCKEESCKPLLSKKKRSINWLFLFLGEFIGFCTLDQLKYFCKYTEVHRTGAKDRLVYSIFRELCKQLTSDEG